MMWPSAVADGACRFGRCLHSVEYKVCTLIRARLDAEISCALEESELVEQPIEVFLQERFGVVGS